MKNRKQIKKLQSVFCAMAYQIIEECREQFAKVENTAGYMPEIAEADGVDFSIDADYSGMWEGRA